MVCQSINHLTDSMKIPFDVKYEIQNNEMETSEVNEIIFGETSDTNLIEVQLNELKLFPSIPIPKMGEEQWKNSLLTLLYELVQKNSKPKLSQINQIQSKLIHKMLLQFDQFLLIKGVLHH